MSLLAQIQAEIKSAMREGRKEDVAAYRLLASELQRVAKDSRVDSLTEEEERKVLVRERKKRLEAAEAFEKGGREELAAKERRESRLIERFLPQPLTEEEMRALIEEAVKETGASSSRDMGRVMGVVMARGGTRVDGKLASRLVKERLSK
ncbi:MAG: GatB/YqeY domain-containing protein [Thermoleophilia bacterium]